MTIIRQCPVCKVKDAHQHHDCRAAQLSDLLFKILAWIKENPDKSLPTEITDEIGRIGPYQTLETFLMDRKKGFSNENIDELFKLLEKGSFVRLSPNHPLSKGFE